MNKKILIIVIIVILVIVGVLAWKSLKTVEAPAVNNETTSQTQASKVTEPTDQQEADAISKEAQSITVDENIGTDVLDTDIKGL